MVRLATLAATLVTAVLSANPGLAQIAAPTGQQNSQQGAIGGAQFSVQGGQSGSGLGVICNEMIAGTFCTSGRSGAGGYGSFSAGTSASNPSLPPCASGMPANELCN